MENNEKITGRFERVIFNNAKNYYTVAFFIIDNSIFDEVTVVGHINDLDYDSEYELIGSYVEHKTYGIQFDFIKYNKKQPTDKDALIRFLSSDLFPGIGQKTAEKIHDALGDDLIDNIKDDPTVIDKANLSVKLSKVLLDGISNSEGDFEQLVAYFSSYGLNVNIILKIEDAYGDKAIKLIEENPYRLMEDIVGVGFKTADKL